MITFVNKLVQHLIETTLEMVEFNLNLYTSKYQQSILCFALRLEDFLDPSQYPLVDLVNTDLPVLAGGRWRVAEGDLLVLLVNYILIRTFPEQAIGIGSDIYWLLLVCNYNYINHRSHCYISATIPGLKNKSLLKPMTWKYQLTSNSSSAHHLLTV